MQRLLTDTDPGVDDALALLYVFASPGVNVEGITTVHGNTDVASATRNVFETLAIAKTEARVFRGSGAPAGDFSHASHVHGDDGLGGWTRGRPAPAMKVEDEPAWQAIPGIARAHPREVTLLTLGPLTNVARALEEDAEGCRMLQRIVAMGGAVWEPGNITAAAEFNIYVDPEAARVVVHSGIPMTLVGLNVTRKAVLTRERMDRFFENRNDRRAEFLRCISRQFLSFYKERTGRELFYLHDPLAAAIALDGSLAETRHAIVDVETHGELTRGMTVADDRAEAGTNANVEICMSIDADRFLDLFCNRVLALTGA